jgi:hypothetical protein
MSYYFSYYNAGTIAVMCLYCYHIVQSSVGETWPVEKLSSVVCGHSYVINFPPRSGGGHFKQFWKFLFETVS